MDDTDTETETEVDTDTETETEVDTDTDTETEELELAPGLLGLSFTLTDPYANHPKARHRLSVQRTELLRGLRRRTGAHFWSSADDGCPKLHIAAHDTDTLGAAMGDLIETIQTSDVDLFLVRPV